MSTLKRKLAGKAAKSTAKHSARGAASKVRREPLRTATLLGIGAVAGASATWFLGHRGSDRPTPQSA